MIRGFLKKWLPSHDAIQKDKNLRWLKSFLHDPNLWHVNRRSVAGGLAVGLFAAFIPLPIQMLIAGLLSLAFRVNVLIAVVATWITNPVTFVPVNYIIYKVGSLIIGNGNSDISHIKEFNFHFKSFSEFWHNIYSWILSLGKAYLVGLPIVSVTVAILGYVLVRVVWRIIITVQYYQKKRATNKILRK